MRDEIRSERAHGATNCFRFVFHSAWIGKVLSLTEHFGYQEDDDSSKEASASEEIYEGVTRGGKHRQY